MGAQIYFKMLTLSNRERINCQTNMENKLNESMGHILFLFCDLFALS